MDAGGQYSSLAFDPAGYPNISYYDEANHTLKYAHQKGSSWVIETVDAGGSVGTHTSLDFDSKGNPWISYYDQTNGYLKCATTASRPTSPPYQPENISPADGAIDIILTPTLQSSDFSDPDTGDSHYASQWQITIASEDYTVPAKIYDSEIDTFNLVGITIPSGTLSIDTPYYWRVRHQDSYGNWSDWSEETSFTTALMQPPATPSNISPDDEATDISLTPTLESSDFSDPDAGDSHTASWWQISLDHQFTNIVYNSGSDNSNLISITIPSGTLSYDTTYYWRVKHQDSYGNWSAWSEETSFTTVASGAPAQPSNISPADGVTDISLTPILHSSVFSDPDAGDTQAASRWQIRTSTGSYSSPLLDSGIDTANLAQFSIPLGLLSYEATYYWQVKYQDSYGNWSDWSEETSFTTVTTSPPNLPLNTSPAEGATEVGLTPTLQSSAFSDPDVVDSQAASQWQVKTSTGSYSDPVFDSETDTANLTAIVLPSDKLDPNTTYYWHVRHQDSYGNWSGWSVETFFSTITMPAPEAAFSISAAEVELGQSITFTDLSEGATSWIWDLGDDTTEEWTTLWPHDPEVENRPRDGQFSHTYAAAKTYTVSLTVLNLAGSDTQTTDITVYTTPQADFSAAPAQPEEGQTVIFTDLSKGADSWRWDFGDGAPKRWDIDTRPADGKITHAYDTAGTYTVSLEISGPRGSDTQTKTITVLAPPAEGFKFRLWMIGAIIGGILVIAGVAYLVWRRQTEAS